MTTELRSGRPYRCLRFGALSCSRVSAAVCSSPAPEHRSAPILSCPSLSRGPSSRCTTVAQGATPAPGCYRQAPQAR